MLGKVAAVVVVALVADERGQRAVEVLEQIRTLKQAAGEEYGCTSAIAGVTVPPVLIAILLQVLDEGVTVVVFAAELFPPLLPTAALADDVPGDALGLVNNRLLVVVEVVVGLGKGLARGLLEDAVETVPTLLDRLLHRCNQFILEQVAGRIRNFDFLQAVMGPIGLDGVAVLDDFRAAFVPLAVGAGPARLFRGGRGLLEYIAHNYYRFLSIRGRRTLRR